MNAAQLEQMETKEILALFNRTTGRKTKKFASRAKGIQQTLRALQNGATMPPTGGRKDAPKAKAERKSAGMSFRLPPRKEQKQPRDGTKRARVLALISRAKGALFSEIQEECDWDLKDAYEGIRLLNVFCGFGLWHEVRGEDYRIFMVPNQKEFEARVRKANAEA